MRHIFTLKNTTKFGWPGLEGRSYSESADFERASAARFRVRGRHGRVRNSLSDRVYIILSGRGWFEIEGEKSEVKIDDVVIVPKDTEYDYGGRMDLFLVHTPAYSRAADVRLEQFGSP